MTSIVGVLCNDGVVIGTDSAATLVAGQLRTIEQQTEKIDIVGSTVIVAGTGQIGLHQRFSSIVGQAYDGSLSQTVPVPPGFSPRPPVTGKVFTKDNPLDIAKTLSRAALEDLSHTYARQGNYGALVAFPCRNEPHLCELTLQDFQPELKDCRRLWYASMGSAQAITDPFLGFIRRAFWEHGAPSVSDAILAVTWTLQHAIDLNPGGVNGPIRLAILEKRDGKYKARTLDDAEIQEYYQHIGEIYIDLGKLKDQRRRADSEAPLDLLKLSE